jgi:hypothetical protein
MNLQMMATSQNEKIKKKERRLWRGTVGYLVHDYKVLLNCIGRDFSKIALERVGNAKHKFHAQQWTDLTRKHA